MAMAACIARGNAVAQTGSHSALSRKELGRADYWSATPKYFANAQRSASKHDGSIKESQKIRLCSAFVGSGVKHQSASARAFSRKARSVNDVRCQAAAGAEEPLPVEVPKVEVPKVETKTESELTKTLQLGALFGGWYLFNIYFNIYNKQVLKVFKFPITCTQVQLGVGVVWALLMWATGLHKKPKVSKEQLIAIVPLALVHALGNLFTNLSLGKVAVSFTHTIKAMEPFFSVLLSSIFLGDKPQLSIILSLLPIVAGVGLASATEASFNWAGFLSAMASNLTFQSRNVLSKKLMVKKEGSLDNINLFSIITILAFFLLLPLTLATEGVKLTPAYLEAAGLDVKQVMTRIFLAGFCFHAYQQVSYMILSKVTPVTHSVGNCVKRVVVIVTSVLFFKTPVSAINAIGTAIALSGVFAYSRVKATLTKKEKTA